MINYEISAKELELRRLLFPSENWEYVRDEPPVNKVNMVLARCKVCGHTEVIPKSKFFRRVCDVECPVCTARLMMLAEGMQIGKYTILYLTKIASKPITCTVLCTKCNRLHFNIRLDLLLLRKYKPEICDCSKIKSPIEFSKKGK